MQTTLDGSDSAADRPLVGDWDGDGDDNPGLYNSSGAGPAEYRLLRYNVTSSNLVENGRGGNPGDTLVGGRWYSGSQKDTVAIWRQADWKLYTPTSSTSGLGTGVPIGGNYYEDKPVFGDWNGDGIDTIGLWRDGANHERNLYISNSNTNISYQLAASGAGNPGDRPVIADWDGDGRDSLALFRPSTGDWFIPDSAGYFGAGVNYGYSDDIAIAGDWDGNGTETLGVYRPGNRYFFPSPSNTSPNVNDQFQLTKLNLQDSDKLIYADWDGDGKDTAGAFRPSTGTVYYGNDAKDPTHNVLQSGISANDNVVAGRWNSATDRDRIATWNQSSWTFTFPNYQTNDIQTRPIGGTPLDDTPVFGDWNGDGVDTIGLWHRPARSFYPSNSNTNISYPTTPTISGLGNPGDIPVVGDWDHDGKDTIALFRPMPNSGQEFYGANPTNDYAIQTSFGNPGDKPAAGDWDGDGFDTVGVSRTPAAAPVSPPPAPPVNTTQFMQAGCQPTTVNGVLGIAVPRPSAVLPSAPSSPVKTAFQGAMQCIGQVAGAKVMLRTQVAIDAIRRPYGTTAAAQEDSRKFGKQLLDDFAALLNYYGVNGVVTLRAHDFTRCNTGVTMRNVPGGGSNALADGVALNSCEFPSEDLYRKMFREVDQRLRADNVNTPTRVMYSAWNEPEHGQQTLQYIDLTEDTRDATAAQWAGKYWRQAALEVGADRVIAGEFASSTTATLATLVSNFNVGAQRNSTNRIANWGAHTYKDLGEGSSTVATWFTNPNNVSGPGGAAIQLWQTENAPKFIGSSAFSGDDAALLSRGSVVRSRLSSANTRIFLYEPVAPSGPANTPDLWDSGLADAAGRARTFMCGLGAAAQSACSGNKQAYPQNSNLWVG